MRQSLWLWRIVAMLFLVLFVAEAYECNQNAQLLRNLQERVVSRGHGDGLK